MPLLRVHRDTQFLDNLPNSTTVQQYALENSISIDEATQRMIQEGWQFQGYNSSNEGVYTK